MYNTIQKQGMHDLFSYFWKIDARFDSLFILPIPSDFFYAQAVVKPCISQSLHLNMQTLSAFPSGV